jgi:hypothetical protein
MQNHIGWADKGIARARIPLCQRAAASASTAVQVKKTLARPASRSAIVGAHYVQYVRLLLLVSARAEEEPWCCSEGALAVRRLNLCVSHGSPSSPFASTTYGARTEHFPCFPYQYVPSSVTVAAALHACGVCDVDDVGWPVQVDWRAVHDHCRYLAAASVLHRIWCKYSINDAITRARQASGFRIQRPLRRALQRSVSPLLCLRRPRNEAIKNFAVLFSVSPHREPGTR